MMTKHLAYCTKQGSHALHQPKSAFFDWSDLAVTFQLEKFVT